MLTRFNNAVITLASITVMNLPTTSSARLAGPTAEPDSDRLIVTSTAYGQTSTIEPEKQRVDPENRLVGRQSVRRISAEALRDALLIVGGNLNREMFGPGIKPPMPSDAISGISSLQRKWI